MAVDVERLTPWAHYMAKADLAQRLRYAVRDTHRGLTELHFGSAEILYRNLIEDLNQPFPCRPDTTLPRVEILDLSAYEDPITAKLRSPVGHPGPVRGARAIGVLHRRGDSSRRRRRLVPRVRGSESRTKMPKHIQDVVYRWRLPRVLLRGVPLRSVLVEDLGRDGVIPSGIVAGMLADLESVVARVAGRSRPLGGGQ